LEAALRLLPALRPLGLPAARLAVKALIAWVRRSRSCSKVLQISAVFMRVRSFPEQSILQGQKPQGYWRFARESGTGLNSAATGTPSVFASLTKV
jgi:hypothetical protein